MPRVRLQQPLCKVTGGNGIVMAEGSTVGEVIDFIEARHGGLRAQIFNERGQIHRHIIISVNDEDVRFLDALGTTVAKDDEVAILPAIAGG